MGLRTASSVPLTTRYERVRVDLVRAPSARFFFFFQAEDGIRDVAVTGVQTCALPISRITPRLRETPRAIPGRQPSLAACVRVFPPTSPAWKIGRASCRERV